ncbi:SHOCT domain-containing protein [Mesorhizobium sp. B2-4-14]|uniref:SHOCT domain-containing protein n=1 Tax=Mesorhizobium sp. B2-4-14 TaxID=2589935 RepID=UPI0011296242|nr:SHOCT domain-containing protein [Mesorhizobium sp. B2-4-14]TPL10182.1 SHOCT domain-containing protein [Mesorhizobium sp. B2-4-14]
MPNTPKEAMAELAAMKARGEINQTEFDMARRIVAEKHAIDQRQGAGPGRTRPVTYRNTACSKGSMLSGVITLAAIICLTIAFGLYTLSGGDRNKGHQSEDATDDVQTVLKVGGATFFLTVTKEVADPMRYELIAKRICKVRSPYGVNGCIVGIWDDDRNMGKDLPMTPEQARSQIYSWSLGRSLWSCRRFPEMAASDRCFTE